MEVTSPIIRKSNHNRSRSRSRSREKFSSKKIENKNSHSKSKKEKNGKKNSSIFDSKELEKKFKDFEAEIHAIDPSNKSEKNETKQKKMFETTENLTLLIKNRIFVEGFPFELIEETEDLERLKDKLEKLHELFKDSKEISKLKPLDPGGKAYLIIEFETRELLEATLIRSECFRIEGIELKIFEKLSLEEDHFIKKEIGKDFLDLLNTSSKNIKENKQANIDIDEKINLPQTSCEENKQQNREENKEEKKEETIELKKKEINEGENEYNHEELNHFQNINAEIIHQSSQPYVLNHESPPPDPLNIGSPSLQYFYSQQQY